MAVIDQRRLHQVPKAGEASKTLFVPELTPVVETLQSPVMTRPWLDWARRVTALLKNQGNGGGGGGGTGDVVGPNGATADAIAVYSGTTGKLIKDGLKTIAQVISDAVSQAVATILPAGKLPVANLPPNVAMRDATNVFTQDNVFQHANPRLYFEETDQPTGARDWEVVVQDQQMRFWALQSGGAMGAEPLTLQRDGDVFVGHDLGVSGQVSASGLDATPINANNITSGTVPDARLSANVQMKPIAAGDLPNHATRHQSGGADPVTITALAGYPGGTTNFLRADGTFAAPTGGGNVVGPANAVTNQIARYADATGKLLKNGGFIVADTGVVSWPSGAKQVFNPSATTAGMNVGSVSAAPSSPANGDVWYDTVTGAAYFRAANANVPITLIDAAAATGSLRTLGTGAQQAAAGNDARFTDARTPTAHATTHKSGGSDPIKLDEVAAPTDVTTLNASATAHGLLPKLSNVATQFLNGQGVWSSPSGGGDVTGPAGVTADNLASYNGATGKIIKDSGVLTSNVALRNNMNNFSEDQYISRLNAGIVLNDTGMAANSRRFHLFNGSGSVFIRPTDDAGSVQNNGLSVSRSGSVAAVGSVYERGRLTAMGEWTTIPFNAGNFFASSGTWTVGAGNVISLAYMLIGKTLLLIIYLTGTSLSATAGSLSMSLPSGFSIGISAIESLSYHNAGTNGSGMIQAYAGAPTQINFYRTIDAGTAWAAGAVYVGGTIPIPIA